MPKALCWRRRGGVWLWRRSKYGGEMAAAWLAQLAMYGGGSVIENGGGMAAAKMAA